MSAKRQNIVTVMTMIALQFGIIFLVTGNQMQVQIQYKNTNTKFGQICPVQVLHSAPVSDKGAASNLRSKPLPFQLRILLKQDTALLSHVSQSVSVSVTGVTSQVFSII